MNLRGRSGGQEGRRGYVRRVEVGGQEARIWGSLEHDGGLVAALQPPEGLDSLYHGRLPDVPYVHLGKLV